MNKPRLCEITGGEFEGKKGTVEYKTEEYSSVLINDYGVAYIDNKYIKYIDG